jgi:hypothetical protein
MEPDQLPVLPPEIQRLERNKKAFDVPDLQLPSYDQIGKSSDKVFDRIPGVDGDTLVPKKPTFQERMQESARKMGEKPDRLNPVGEYSRAQAEGFDNPLIPYDPTIDMNEVYAKYDPTTWKDVAQKTWDTYTLNAMSGMKTLWYGLKDGITEGRASAIYDNQYSRELATMTQAMDKMNPMRFSKEEQGTTSTWFKQVLPSLGYVAAGATEIAAQHVLLSLGGAAIGAVVGEGVGAVPGAVVGNLAAYAKDAQTVSSVLANMGRVARAAAVGETVGASVEALSNANRIKSAAQMFGRGLLATNGEAALMGQLASNRALEEQKASYYKETGQYLSGDKLKEAEDQSKKTGGVTYALNLPLLAAGEVYTFGNLLRGKAIPSITENLAFKINKATGKAATTNTLLKVSGRVFGNAAVQGNEEIWQSVIEDASVNYFTKKKENRDNYLEEFANATMKRAKSGEAMSDFMSGAVIGIIPGSFEFLGYNAVKRNSQEAVDKYNSSTEIYFNRLGDNLRTNDKLRDAMANGDGESAREEHRNHIVGLVNSLSRIGSVQAFSETLDALSEMDNTEFKKYTGISLTEEAQSKLLSDVTTEFKRAAKIRQQVDTAYQVNPFEAESWFQQKLNKYRTGFDVDKGKAEEVWDVFKATLTSNLIKHGDVGQERQVIEDEGSQMSPEFIGITGADVPAIIEAKKADLRSKIAATLPGYTKDKALLERIEAHEDTGSQYQEILNDAERKTPGIKEMVLYHNRQLQQEQLLFNEIGRLNSDAGQRREIKKIIDWQNWYDTKIAGPKEEVQAPTIESAPAAEVATPAPEAPTVAPAEGPVTVPNVTPEVVPTPENTPVVPTTGPQVQEDMPFVPDTTTTEDLDSLYGEGKGEDYIPEVQTPSVREQPEPTHITAPVIDPSLPEDIQVDNTAIPDAISGMKEGETLVPEESGVEVSLNGEEIEKFDKPIGEKGNVKGTKKSGEVIDINESDLPLLRTEKAEETPVTNAASFIQENRLSQEQATMLNSLISNNYVELQC